MDQAIVGRILNVIHSLRGINLRVEQLDQSMEIVRCVNELAKIGSELSADLKEEKNNVQPD